MNESREFRRINETERKIIESSISKISPGILSKLNKIEFQLLISFNLLDSIDRYPKIFLISNDHANLITIINQEFKITTAGLYFGFIKKDKFLLSLEGAEYLHNQGLFSQVQRIYTTIEGEKSILYGNNVLKKMIEGLPSNLKKNGFLLVFNQAKELIAVAKSQVDFQTSLKLKDNNIIALNLVDKGSYLRIKQ